ncbi:hypothetical protein CR513_47568, partial [Mucuna pruriens]
MGLNITLPLLSYFFLTEAPHIWAFFLTCFTPPYLYILINFIILTIVGSSKLHNHRHHHSPSKDTVLLPTDPGIYDRPPAVQIHIPDTVNITVTTQIDYDTDVAASDKYLNETKLTSSYDTIIEGNGSIGIVYDKNTSVKAMVNDDNSIGAVSPSLQRKYSLEGEGGGEGEEAGDAGEHVEDDNGGVRCGDVGDVGDTVKGFERWGSDVEVEGVRRKGEECVYEADEGVIAESRRVKPASGSLHQQVQREDEVAEARILHELNRLRVTTQTISARKPEFDEELLKMFRKVEINIPLLDVIKQIPKYEKFLKELCVHKRKKMKRSAEIGGVMFALTKNAEFTAGAQQALPKKCRDLGIFSVPSTIGDCTFADAMLDLGALINVMPTWIYKSLNF